MSNKVMMCEVQVDSAERRLEPISGHRFRSISRSCRTHGRYLSWHYDADGLPRTFQEFIGYFLNLFISQKIIPETTANIPKYAK